MDDKLKASGLSHLSLVLLAFGVGYLLHYIFWLLFDNLDPVSRRFKLWLFTWIRRLPPVRNYIKGELDRAKKRLTDQKITEDAAKTPDDKKMLSALPRLPNKATSGSDIMKRLDCYSRVLADDGNVWKSSKISGGVYHIRKEFDDLAVKVFQQQIHANPLHFDVFGDARRCEAELVAWVWRLYNGPAGQDPVGAVTAGGTESIVMAVLACRNRALKKGIRWPEIVASTTAHVALEKAAEMFRMRVVKVAPKWPDGGADVTGFRRAITKNTCMLFTSAPSFPWGCVDPVREIAAIGKSYDIPVHADCCLGGFLIPFVHDAGYDFQHGPVDFRIEGVTTISVDTHKYGFTPKGSSLILYRNSELRQHQLFVATQWPGGVYATPGLAGSRSGAIVVAAWATVLHMGYDGYVESTKQIIRVSREIRDRIPRIPGLKVIGRGDLSVVAFGMEDPALSNCIYIILDKMTHKGWNLNTLQYPSGLHIAVTDSHTKEGFVDGFISDLATATSSTLTDVKSGKTDPKSGSAAIYGTTQSIPDRSIVEDFVKQVIEDALTV